MSSGWFFWLLAIPTVIGGLGVIFFVAATVWDADIWKWKS